MTMQRRGFLAAMLAAAAAPAIVKAESLMKLYVPPARKVWTPYGHDLGTGDWTVDAWLPDGQWRHVAVTRAGGVTKTYVDGELVPNNHPLREALKDATQVPRPPMDEFRITRGVARYEGRFMAPRLQFP